MSEAFLANLPLPGSVILGALAAAVYVLGFVRTRQRSFTIIDTFMVVAIMAVVSAMTMPLLI